MKGRKRGQDTSPLGYARFATENARQRVVVNLLSPIEPFGLSASDISTINKTSSQFVTRHFRRDYLSAAKDGFFMFGTLANYRGNESQKLARLGDITEASQVEYFRSRTGNYGHLDHGNARDVNIHNIYGNGGVAIETTANEYCSCSSIGRFSHNRADTFRSKGNSDIGAYVVYDLARLSYIIQKTVSTNHRTRHLALVAREVVYGKKDGYWLVNDSVPNLNGRDPLKLWLEMAFVKPQTYTHEEEVRLILLDQNNLGQLSKTAPNLHVSNREISDAIVDFGEF